MAPPCGWHPNELARKLLPMSSAARIWALAIGGAGLAGGVAMALATRGGGFMAVLPGALIIGSVLFERRYHPAKGKAAPTGPGWQQTAETFRDEETGRMVTVWWHAATGERRYVQGDTP